MRLLADQAAIAIRNAELFESTQRQIQELKLLYSLALSGAEATDEDDLIEHATELIGNTLYPDNFGVLLLTMTQETHYRCTSLINAKFGGLDSVHAFPLGRV